MVSICVRSINIRIRISIRIRSIRRENLAKVDLNGWPRVAILCTLCAIVCAFNAPFKISQYGSTTCGFSSLRFPLFLSIVLGRWVALQDRKYLMDSVPLPHSQRTNFARSTHLVGGFDFDPL